MRHSRAHGGLAWRCHDVENVRRTAQSLFSQSSVFEQPAHSKSATCRRLESKTSGLSYAWFTARVALRLEERVLVQVIRM